MKDYPSIKPPRLADRLFEWHCENASIEDLHGDVEELFYADLKEMPAWKAKAKYWQQIISLMLSYSVKRRRQKSSFSTYSNSSINYTMISHYAKITFRHLMKDKVFSLINVLGLSVGIVAFFLIIQYASFEFSFEQFHENKKEIYRIAYKQFKNGEVKATSAMNYGGFRALLKNNFPEVISTTGFSPMPNNLGFLIKYNNKMFLEPGKFLRADSNFFRVFPSLLLRGNKTSVLHDPHSLIISEKVARKVFGDEDPIGKQISKDHIVTGILKDIPENSHLHADFINRTDKEWDSEDAYWKGSPGFYTYATIRQGTDIQVLEKKLNGILKKVHPELQGITASIQPIASIHLQSHLQNELEANGNQTLVYVLVMIGVIILVIAWINYVNMETARFISRIREVGVRRIIGSGKGGLAMQYLIEYFYLNVLALGFAWLMIQFVLPHFSNLTGTPISNIQLTIPAIWIGALALFAFGSVMTGIYPLWFLLKMNPVVALKNNIDGFQRKAGTRRSLMFIQFVSSLVLIGFLFVINQQVEFMRTTNKKIDVDRVISIRNPTAYGDMGFKEQYLEFQQLENRLLQNPAIKMVSGTSAIPGTEVGFTFINFLKRSLSDPYSATRYKMMFIDFNFIPLYGLKLKSGRNFNSSLGEDTEVAKKLMNDEKPPKDYYLTLMLNESAIHALGFQSTEEALNQIIYLHLWADDFEKYKIVGIVEDYHHEALKKEVNPIIFTLNYDHFQQAYYSIKLNTGANPHEALTYIEKSWKELFPTKPFDYFFMDEYYDQQFKSEKHFERIFGSFAAVGVFLACLGILGISLFEANARLKEISIRKVLGASVLNLVALLSKDNIKMILLSCLLAMPAIYFVSSNWLSTYPVRIKLSPIAFIIPLVILLVVVFFTSIIQTLKASLTNPVDHLRNE